MSEQSISVPESLAQLAQEKGFPLDLVKRALALGFPPGAIASQIQAGVDPQAVAAFLDEQERIRAGGEIQIPDDVMALAQKRRWSEELIKRALRTGMTMERVKGLLEAGLRADQMLRMIIITERIREQGPPATLEWMEAKTEWGIRVKPGKKGLTLGSLNVGTYGDIPDYWPRQTEMPRGALPNPLSPSMGYSIYEKAELWADNAADLYEEAIQRQWKPATHIPWDSIPSLPEPQEQALAQLCTYMCQNAIVVSDTIGKWLKEMSYGYHEVKVFLATVAYDYARHFDVFRKRAYLNGVGMGRQSPGYYLRVIKDARRWTEASTMMFIFNASFLLHLCQVGYYASRSEGDALIFRLAMQDLARHTSYGAQHLRYFLSRKPEALLEIDGYLQKIEAFFAYEDDKDPTLQEALIVLLGGGVGEEELKRGWRLLKRFRARWISDYLWRLEAAGMPERRKGLFFYLRQWLPEPAPAP